jgi:adenylate kinase
MNMILIGAQGSGKGTQAQLLAERTDLRPCASGDLLREAIARQTPLGLAARPYYERGELVPDELVIGMILERMQEQESGTGIILDGFPRTLAQARALDEQLRTRGRRIDCVIYLEVPRALLLDRLTGRYLCRAQGHVWNVKTNPPRVPGVCDYDGSELYQRSDDTPEKIERRLDIFFSETIQLVDYYAAQGKLTRVDGQGEIEDVYQAVVAGCAELTGSMPGSRGEQPDAR